LDHAGDARERARARLPVPPRLARAGRAFYALAFWESREGASAFFRLWEIESEPGEEAIVLEGDVGLVPLPADL